MTDKKNELKTADMDKVTGGSLLDDLIDAFKKPTIDHNSPDIQPGGFHPDRDVTK